MSIGPAGENLVGFAAIAVNNGHVAARCMLPGVITGTKAGFIPTRNYTTNVSGMAPEILETYSPENIRVTFKARPNPCWACASKHCHTGRTNLGKYAGRTVEEPEYERMAAFSALAVV